MGDVEHFGFIGERRGLITLDWLKNEPDVYVKASDYHELEQKCEVLLTHIVGEECPSCGEHKVVEGCSKGCLACDWQESIDEGE